MSPPRKILYVDTGREYGGGIESLLMLVEGLDRGRFSPEVLFYHELFYGPRAVRELFEGLDTRFHVHQPRTPGLYKPLKEVVRAATLGSKRAVRRLDRALVGSALRRELGGLIEGLAPDLIHTNNQPSSNREVMEAAAGLGTPLVGHLRKIVGLAPREAGEANRAASAFIAVSRATAEAYAHQGIDASKIRVVYNGVSTGGAALTRDGPEAQELGVGRDDLVVVNVSSFLGFKGQDLLLFAAYGLLPRFENLKLLFIGEGPKMEAMKKTAASLGLDKAAIFAGFRPDAARFFSLADVAVIPSLNESFPRAALEAMAFGAPLVASKVGGIPEQVADGETGFLFPPGDAGELAARLEELLADPGLRREMGRRAGERAEKLFSPENYVGGVTRVYEEVLGG